MSGRRGIPTRYAETQFRSRLEARWAAFFDAIGWRWEYEPFDLAGYVPDFLLLGDAPVLVEVRPIASYDEAELIANCLPLHETYPPLVVGCSPLLIPDDDVAGAIGQYGYASLADEPLAEPTLADDISIDLAGWGQCVTCAALYVVQYSGGWIPHPTSCRHLAVARSGARGPGLWDDGKQRIDLAWAEARNRTQWRRAS